MNSDNEKIYNSMKFSAVLNIIIGVILIVFGVTAGVLMLVSGGKLINNKSKILF